MTAAFSTTLYQMAFAVMNTAHYLLFVMFIISLVRIFVVANTPYSSYFVGIYAFVNSFYGGCPLIEIQNHLAKQFGGYIEDPMSGFMIFGENAMLVRGAVMTASILLVYVAYKSWDKATKPVNWSNIFASQIRGSVS